MTVVIVYVQRDIPLDENMTEKERLKLISENADAKILDEMFGGKADDGSCCCE